MRSPDQSSSGLRARLLLAGLLLLAGCSSTFRGKILHQQLRNVKVHETWYKLWSTKQATVARPHVRVKVSRYQRKEYDYKYTHELRDKETKAVVGRETAGWKHAEDTRRKDVPFQIIASGLDYTLIKALADSQRRAGEATKRYDRSLKPQLKAADQPNKAADRLNKKQTGHGKK